MVPLEINKRALNIAYRYMKKMLILATGMAMDICLRRPTLAANQLHVVTAINRRDTPDRYTHTHSVATASTGPRHSISSFTLAVKLLISSLMKLHQPVTQSKL